MRNILAVASAIDMEPHVLGTTNVWPGLNMEMASAKRRYTTSLKDGGSTTQVCFTNHVIHSHN